MRGRSRWIPHNANPSDALTKIIGAHVQPLMDLLKSGFYHLKTEEAELKERAEAKEKTGYAPPLKQLLLRLENHDSRLQNLFPLV